MNALLQSQIFFFISSVGFIILGIFAGVFLFYLVQISRTLSRIVNKAEEDINKIGDTTKELLEELKESSLFQFLAKFFKKKKKYEKK